MVSPLQLKNKKLKILHAPHNVAKQPLYISKIEKEKGYVSDLIVNYPPAYGLSADLIISDFQNFNIKSIIKRFYYSLASIFKYDIFNYYFGKTLFTWDDYFGPRNWLWYWDLKIAKLLGKKVIMTFQGCDLRQSEIGEKYKHSACSSLKCPQYAVCQLQYDKQRQWLVKNILPKVDHIFFLNPDLGYYVSHLKSSFLPYASVPVHDFVVSLPKVSGRIKIVHAPSVPTLKGTPEIFEAIDNLKEKHDIELILIQNMPYAEALTHYHQADLVIDQINIGWYGAFAVEVMAMGKPVACYLREEDYKYLPSKFAEDIPIYNLDPNNLIESLELIIADRSNWQKKGKESRNFVEKWHDPKKIQEIVFNKYIE